jgi:hypothetical protein
MELPTEAKLGEVMAGVAAGEGHEVGDGEDWASPDAAVHTLGLLKGKILKKLQHRVKVNGGSIYFSICWTFVDR